MLLSEGSQELSAALDERRAAPGEPLPQQGATVCADCTEVVHVCPSSRRPCRDAIPVTRAYLVNSHLLRPTRIGRLVRSFRLHSPHYARETIAESCSTRVALATAIIGQSGSL